QDQLGIQLQVTSTIGKGTTVKLIFPLQNEVVERMSEVTNLSF
ncbi:sensor histidine kinase, partial [Staphylococcus aureus]|nr:sensor histidine kinase [Staphylococcus aureus]